MGPLHYISKVSTGKSKNQNSPDVQSIAFIYADSCATIIFKFNIWKQLGISNYTLFSTCNYSQYEIKVPLYITRVAFL